MTSATVIAGVMAFDRVRDVQAQGGFQNVGGDGDAGQQERTQCLSQQPTGGCDCG